MYETQSNRILVQCVSTDNIHLSVKLHFGLALVPSELSLDGLIQLILVAAGFSNRHKG